MPNGTTHAMTTIALAFASGVVAQHLGYSDHHILALSGGTLAGLVLTPDLDVDRGCISNQVVRRTAGRGWAQLWATYWRPYSLMMPHRSKLSHLPLVGTTVRLLYLAILPALIYWLAIAVGFTAGSRWVHPVFPAWGWWAFGGLVLADTLHFMLDQIF